MKKTILVADDDPAVRRMLCRVLAGENYDVLAARDGQEALEMCKADRLDLVLLDLSLSLKNGWEYSNGLAPKTLRTGDHHYRATEPDFSCFGLRGRSVDGKAADLPNCCALFTSFWRSRLRASLPEWRAGQPNSTTCRRSERGPHKIQAPITRESRSIWSCFGVWSLGPRLSQRPPWGDIRLHGVAPARVAACVQPAAQSFLHCRCRESVRPAAVSGCCADRPPIAPGEGLGCE